MRKFAVLGSLIALLLVAAVQSASPPLDMHDTSHLATAYELINALNSLRLTNGLTPYNSNSILMGIAQNQAEYMASIGTWTHTGPDGSRPYQRALAAGYPVAGDLSLGGWFSENVGLGIDLTVDGIIEMWMGDAPHQNTMLSPNLVDIGAGVAISGNTFYYVIDCGLSTGGTPVVYTPPAYLSTGTTIPNTPNNDGSIIHIVQKNETLFGLALSYGVPLDDILVLNGLTTTSIIYIGQKIIIRVAFTPTPTLPTSTPTKFPTATLWPTSTVTVTSTFLPTMTTSANQSPGLPISVTAGIVGLIVILALITAAFFAFLGKKKQE
jgi:uncharacterized protein YkwD